MGSCRTGFTGQTWRPDVVKFDGKEQLERHADRCEILPGMRTCAVVRKTCGLLASSKEHGFYLDAKAQQICCPARAVAIHTCADLAQPTCSLEPRLVNAAEAGYGGKVVEWRVTQFAWLLDDVQKAIGSTGLGKDGMLASSLASYALGQPIQVSDENVEQELMRWMIGDYTREGIDGSCNERLRERTDLNEYDAPIDPLVFPHLYRAGYEWIRAGTVWGSTYGIFKYARMMVWVENTPCRHVSNTTSQMCQYEFLYLVQRQKSLCDVVTDDYPYFNLVRFDAQANAIDKCRLFMAQNEFFSMRTKVICVGEDSAFHPESIDVHTAYKMSKVAEDSWKVWRGADERTQALFEVQGEWPHEMMDIYKLEPARGERMWVGQINAGKTAGGKVALSDASQETVETGKRLKNAFGIAVERFQDAGLFFAMAVVADREMDNQEAEYKARQADARNTETPSEPLQPPLQSSATGLLPVVSAGLACIVGGVSALGSGGR